MMLSPSSITEPAYEDGGAVAGTAPCAEANRVSFVVDNLRMRVIASAAESVVLNPSTIGRSPPTKHNRLIASGVRCSRPGVDRMGEARGGITGMVAAEGCAGVTGVPPLEDGVAGSATIGAGRSGGRGGTGGITVDAGGAGS